MWVKVRQTDIHTYWVCVCVWGGHVHSHTATHESQKYQVLLELEFKVMSCLMWVLGSELVSSHTFDRWAISPATYFFLIIISLFLIISYMCTTKYHHIHPYFLLSNPLYTPKQWLLPNFVFSGTALSALFLVYFCLFDFVFDNLLSLVVLSICARVYSHSLENGKQNTLEKEGFFFPSICQLL